jgi:hypothetical protein
VLAAGAACAEQYTFTTLIQGAYQEQTTIYCDGTRISGRVPTNGCTLIERATAYLNHWINRHTMGVACAAGHPIMFHPNGTWAECTLDAEQPVDVTGLGFTVALGTCKGLVRFDKDGRVEC